MMRLAIRAFLALALLAAAASALPAQTASTPHDQVISANPFGILLELFNAEYEHVVSGSSSVGIGGSYYGLSDEEYLNADLFWRYYPQGRPLEGWAFGVKAGITRGDLDTGLDGEEESRTLFGVGFDANHSWLLGESDKFYIGIGFGLKRLFGSDADDLIEILPTFRIINIGIAF